ncbi:hypothetical protein LTR28_010570 [Elasticomyces elasticus]|nr:hypothetical protein LTR28_010570 [Elasticomyces elasticus]
MVEVLTSVEVVADGVLEVVGSTRKAVVLMGIVERAGTLKNLPWAVELVLEEDAVFAIAIDAVAEPFNKIVDTPDRLEDVGLPLGLYEEELVGRTGSPEEVSDADLPVGSAREEFVENVESPEVVERMDGTVGFARVTFSDAVRKPKDPVPERSAYGGPSSSAQSPGRSLVKPKFGRSIC